MLHELRDLLDDVAENLGILFEEVEYLYYKHVVSV
jgi:hypothetical protein